MRRHIYRQKEFFQDELPVLVTTDLHLPRGGDDRLNTREFWQFTLIGGNIRQKFFARTLALEAGTIFFSRPGDLTSSEFDAPVRITHLLIRAPLMDELGRSPETAELLRDRADGLRKIRATARLRGLLRRIRTETGHTDRFTRAALACFVREFVIEFLRAEDAERRRDENTGRVAEAEAYLAAHFREKVAAADVAAHVGLTPSHLRARFKHETGRTIHDALTSLRVKAACEMLRATALTHREIREACGFPNMASFYTAVRRACGQTPEAVRRAYDDAKRKENGR